jgi:cysteine synthase A
MADKVVDREYLEKHGVEEAISQALAQLGREKPANALARLSELLCPHRPGTDSYLSLVGSTPMVKLSKLLPAESRAKAVYAKMEMQNPGGSIKDRIAKHIVERAEAAGELRSGMTIVEYTSGNTGIGLAMVAAAKGYKCIIIMPQVPTMFERYIIVRQFGAEVILTAPAYGVRGLQKAYTDLIDSDPHLYFGANQFKNPANPEAHYATTGPEIWAQTLGEVDFLLHGIGTGGTLGGAGKYLKERKPSVKIVGIEPSNARVHIGAAHGPHTIVGIGAGIPTHFLGLPTNASGEPVALEGETPTSVIDVWAHASSDEALAWATRACTVEGMMVGPSAGAALKVACELACTPEAEGKTIVVILPSHGIRYGLHPMWAAVKEEATAALPAQPNMDKTIEVIQWSSMAANKKAAE